MAFVEDELHLSPIAVACAARIQMAANGLDQMRKLLERAGLGAPPVPNELAADLTEHGEWFYATREIDRAKMYSPPRYAAEVVAGPVEDYVAFCHVGHGINS